MKRNTYYYESYKDDFAVTKNLKYDLIDKKYKYEPNIIFRFFSFILYFIIAKPLIWLIMKMVYGLRIKNKKVLKECRNNGFYIYGNHTNYMPDAYVPNLLRWRRNYIIVGGQTASINGVKTIIKALGARPLGDTIEAKKNLFRFMKNSINKKKSITIYPEAHIWPYYTSVRPFDSINMKYQVLLNAPSYSISYCYSKRKIRKIPRITVYVDGPFYPDLSLDTKLRQEKLASDIYNKIKERTDIYSTYSVNNYIKKE
ncbi:MAG: hypothetical protein IKP77_02615 [Acholeplasmatales bacterium]|nr:hypothetical protein [Acholeplasmatales bacterium]